MRAPATTLLLGALPALAAGAFVLGISDVGRGAWFVQGASVLLMLAIAASMGLPVASLRQRGLVVVACAAIVGCALPLLAGTDGPRRWLAAGPLSLYVAPVALPSLLAIAARVSRSSARWNSVSIAGLWLTAVILAVQPDLSQVLALTAGAVFIVCHGSTPRRRRALTLLAFVVPILAAAAQDDPLAPVPHVELVFEVSWRHSIGAGLGVSAAAFALLATVARRMARIEPSMIGVAVYYGVLFACSMPGWTPAPLMGFGAGPLLGFGLLAGTAGQLERRS